MNLEGKVAIVTGGNGGLGQRICHALDDAGCTIAVIYNESKAEAESVATRLNSAKAFQCDVRDTERVDRMVGEVREAFGGVDILVNDAAFNAWIPFNDLDAMTHEAWEKILDVNLNGPMRCIKAVVPLMKVAGAGRIVNIGSTAGFTPVGSSIPYAVSKAALIHLTRCMAVGLAPEILVNCVAPGFIEGTRTSSNLSEAYKERARASVALKKAVDKDDIARQVVQFCKTDTMTGSTLTIDAGRVYH